MIRITWFVLRFIDIMKFKVEKKFSNWQLKSRQTLSCNNEIKKELTNNLSIVLDKNGLLHVKGRLQNSLLLYEIKFPVLLNKNGLIVRAIIFDCDRKVLHSGLKNTLNELRCNFWVEE